MQSPALKLLNHSTLTSDIYYTCAPTPLQMGAAAGFESPKSFFDDLQTKYQHKRDLFCSALTDAGMSPIVPQGAYYVLADISQFGFASSKECAMAILEQAKVACIPGTAFYQGDEGQNLVRFCFAVEDDLVEEAAQRIRRFKR